MDLQHISLIVHQLEIILVLQHLNMLDNIGKLQTMIVILVIQSVLLIHAGEENIVDILVMVETALTLFLSLFSQEDILI